MATTTVALKVHVTWWVKPYLLCVSFFAEMFGFAPDFEKVGRFAARGVFPLIDGKRARYQRITPPPPWVHTPDDGRGQRKVFLNGNPVKHVMYADERAGKIRVAEQPVRIDPRSGEIVTYTLRGKVTVLPFKQPVHESSPSPQADGAAPTQQ